MSSRRSVGESRPGAVSRDRRLPGRSLLRMQSPTDVDIEGCADRGSIRLCRVERRLLNRQNAGLVQSSKTCRFTDADIVRGAIFLYKSMNRAISFLMHLSRFQRIVIW